MRDAIAPASMLGRVLYVTAVPDRARNMLIRRGRLPPGAYGDAEIELAISTMIDDEGR
jgi:hypothetical protein